MSSAAVLESARARRVESGGTLCRCSPRCARRGWSPTSPRSYSAGISACEKGEQWQQALSLLSEMSERKVDLDVVSCSACVSACEKGGQWEHALRLLVVMCEARLEPNLQCCDQRVREIRAVAAGVSFAPRDGEGKG
ncbi:unnamed protein product [Prorocentrum cordatum]|uniref:Pentatricopeptide repeat-containing protein n=1 Tax=Prorocentrum cordatum TaxID=2364126 RepID=A0ABN9WVM5_9DINO|nr:unnamed protein product [Polarella glacialis]